MVKACPVGSHRLSFGVCEGLIPAATLSAVELRRVSVTPLKSIGPKRY